MRCSQCGHPDNPDDANFCENCGAEVGVSADRPVVAEPPAVENGAVAGAESANAMGAGSGVETAGLSGWTCACGQVNDTGEEYCGRCGEARPAAALALTHGDRFGGFEILGRLGPQAFTVRGISDDAANVGVPTGVLQFGDEQQLKALSDTIAALDPATLTQRLGYLPVPQVLAGGNGPGQGSYLVLSRPEGEWAPADSVPALTVDVAAALLAALLTMVDRATAIGRLLLLAPAQLLLQGSQLFLSQPVAPRLPLVQPLLADPALLPPELLQGSFGSDPPPAIDAWEAGAYSAAATVQTMTANGLGLPRLWHQLLERLLAADPTSRPHSLNEVLATLATATAAVAVTAHRTAWLTDIGHHHAVNQDAGGVWSWQRDGSSPVTLAVVADGVSAGKHSEEASALTVDLLRQRLDGACSGTSFDLDQAESLLLQAGVEAHRQISALPFQNYDEASATTLVAVCLIGGDAVGIWCGDSRAYGVTAASCVALSRDHSWVNLMVESGRMTIEQARADRRAHVIARWLGISEPPVGDPGFDRFRCRLAPGDRLLLCSDGLYMYFEPPQAEESQMAHIIAKHGDDLEGAAGELVQTALDRGGFDNITAVLVAAE